MYPAFDYCTGCIQSEPTGHVDVSVSNIIQLLNLSPNKKYTLALYAASQNRNVIEFFPKKNSYLRIQYVLIKSWGGVRWRLSPQRLGYPLLKTCKTLLHNISYKLYNISYIINMIYNIHNMYRIYIIYLHSRPIEGTDISSYRPSYVPPPPTLPISPAFLISWSTTHWRYAFDLSNRMP